jgi:hypothetical protein
VALLREDATFPMPPWLQWYSGREAIRSFFAIAWKTCGGLRLIPTAANGQPAFAVYERTGADAPWAAHSIHVLALEHDMISTLTLFVPPTGRSCFRPLDFRSSSRTPRAPNCCPRRTTPKTDAPLCGATLRFWQWERLLFFTSSLRMAQKWFIKKLDSVYVPQ